MSLPRRFAIISPNYYPRTCGVGDHSTRLGVHLRKRGHDVRVFAPDPVSATPDAPELEVRGVARSSPMLIAMRISRLIRDFAPADVLLQFTPQMWDTWRFGSPALPWLAAQARRHGARVTLIAHELYVPWRVRPDLCAAAALQRLQFGALIKACDRVLVTTQTRASDVLPVTRLLGLPEPAVIRVGANALPQSHIGAFSTNAPRIGLFSTAAVGKRFDVVLDAFARVTKELPSAQLVLIGDLGPPDRARVREIRQAVAAHPSGDRIVLTGKLSLAEIAREIASLDLYFFPMDAGASTRSGTLPVALGSGLPVIAVHGFETDGDLFVDGENIVMAPSLTGAGFAEAALQVLRHPDRMARIGQGARKLYEGHLSWDRIVETLLEPPGPDHRDKNGRSTIQ